MKNNLFVVVLMLLSISFFSGCTGDLEPNTVWDGIVWDGGVDSKGVYWIVLDTILGNMTKVLGSGDYSFILDLVYGEFYSFYGYVGVDDSIFSSGVAVNQFKLLEVHDKDDNIIWSE